MCAPSCLARISFCDVQVLSKGSRYIPVSLECFKAYTPIRQFQDLTGREKESNENVGAQLSVLPVAYAGVDAYGTSVWCPPEWPLCSL